MAEVGVTAAAKLVEYLVDPILQRLQYLFCVGKISRNVEIRKEELILKQGRVQELVQEAMNRTERIDDEVGKWKNDVKSVIAEVENSEAQLRANNGCLQRWCPTWKRYCLFKNLAKMTNRMIDLTTKSDNFNPFSHNVTVPDIEYHSSHDFMLFESTKKACDELWVALQHDDSSMIGLWGMGGSGKTTLVKEVGKKAKESKLFDRVVITTVSQTPNIRKIQGEIADFLGLKLEEETEVGRARRISMKLQIANERLLIILDDVWATLNLEDIGNPRNYCKVLLTTRRQEVCTLMDCQKTIPLGLLTKDEAWDLFRTHAKVDDGAREVAQEVAMECKGLPIAIVAMGKCLKGKGLDEMNVVLHNLRRSKPVDVDQGEIDAFTCLKLSYDYLSNVEAKLLFLMCAIFPEDYEIIIEDLFRYAVGLGLCKDAESFEMARRKVRAAINVLIDSSLLMFSLNVKKEKCVKMHDIVRDVALWIAPKEHGTIMVNVAKKLNELVADKAVNDCYAISSWYENDKFLQFASQLDAPKLEFLLVCTWKPLDISHVSFEGIKGLKTLIIEGIVGVNLIELQHQSIQNLSKLQTLRLQCCHLHDISFVVSLTRLEILDLQGSKFERLPNGIEKLNKLKLLDLSRCAIDECCFKVIGHCLQLEELYVPKHSRYTKKENCYEYLVGLKAMTNLRRYNLVLGECNGEDLESQNDPRSLEMGQLNMCMLSSIIKDLAHRATAIQFYELEGGSKSFMPNIVQVVGGMYELTKLCLQKCSKIECIADEISLHDEDVTVPRLDELELRDMDNIRQIHRGPSPVSLFQKMERLIIFNCPQLLHIFPTDSNLGNLKFLKISKCPMLTSLFPISTACTLFSLEKLEIERCSKLKHVLEGEYGGDAWKNSKFPTLKRLSIDECHELEYVCAVLAQRFVQLQHLFIKDAPQMKFVFGENVGREQTMHDQDETQLVLPLLENLELDNLPNLVGICPEMCHTMWPSMKTVKCRNCPNMELHELQGHQLRNEKFKPLEVIERIALHNCRVESIFHYQIRFEEQAPTFQSLKELTLEKCARLKIVFFGHICQSLPELTSLTISCCDDLEAIFGGNEEAQKNLSIADGSFLLRLNNLRLSKCNKLKFIFSFMTSGATSVLPQLCTLTVSDCSQMEEIFKCSNIEYNDSNSERVMTFPNMKKMELMNLPRLINVCQGFKLHIGEFRKVKVHDCPKLMPIKSTIVDWTKQRLVREYVLKHNQLNKNEDLNLPLSVLYVGELDIQNPRVEHNWRVIGDDEEEETNILGSLVPTQVLSFQYIHSLEVTHNKNLKFLFSNSTIIHNSLPKLTSLSLSECEELEEIIAENEEHEITSNSQVGFPELRELKVKRCNKLKRLFSTSATTIVLPSLIKIELKNLANFISICQGSQFQVVELSNIIICNCPKFVDSSLGSALQQLATILELQKCKGHQLRNEEYKPLAAIKRIKLDNCGVESIFHYQNGVEAQGPTFQYLKELTLENCVRMKFVFSAKICQSLPELTSVTIANCEELEAIFLGNEEAQKNLAITEFYLVKLKSLKISKCNKLKFILSFIISAATISMLPQLSTLTISNCSQMEGIFKCSNVEDRYIDREREITFPNMKDMKLKNLPTLFNIFEGFKLHTGELGTIKVRNCPKLLPIKSVTIVHTEERLVRDYELKYNHLSNDEALNLPLSILNIGELDSQIHIVEHNWRVTGDDEEEESNDSIMLRSEQQMQGCLVPSQVWSFQYLHSLEVTQIKKLKFLFSKSTIVQNSLPKLTSLTLSDCEELEVIFGHGGEDDANYDETIVFPSLWRIELTNLPNLKSVCQGSQFQVELMRDITICNCPKFVDSSLGSALQQLGTLSVSAEDSNFQTTSRVESLSFGDTRNLISVWEGPTFILFQNLKSLHVYKCRRLKCIFPSTVIRSLPCLQNVRIQECEELEEIMSSEEEEHHISNESFHSFCFPQLRSLMVLNCKRLKWLFPFLSSTQLLPQLMSLWILNCAQVKGLSNCEPEIHDEECFDFNNLLPNLKDFTVEDCPIFSKITFAALQSCQRRNKLIDDEFHFWL